MNYLKTTFSGKVGRTKVQVKKVQAPKVMGNLTYWDIAEIRLCEVRARAEALSECRAWSEIDIHYPPLPEIGGFFGVQK